MLRDALPKDAEGQIDLSSFGVFATKNGQVLACSDSLFSPGDKLAISTTLNNLDPGEELTNITPLRGHYYAIGAHASSGYREYKSETDSYKNDVIALVGKELCVMTENREETEALPCPTVHSDRGHAETTVEIAAFRLGDEWFGIRANQILQAIDTKNITPAPGAGADRVGYIMYEELPIPVFDIRNIVCAIRSSTEQMNRKAQQVIVIEKNANTRFGVMADALGEIPEIHMSRMNALPNALGGRELMADAAIAPDKPGEECLLLVLSSDRLAQKLASGMGEPSSGRAQKLIKV
ncbi:MAG: chemotaxis protein CheW [Methylobacter sp.]|nr:chemotaxis protein CheW [Methylobacter sp.]